MKKPLKVFVSYAREDALFKDKLLEHLSSLTREKIIESWENSQIQIGEEWETSILQALQNADIILLLISSDALASSFIQDVEVMKAMEKNTRKESLLIPVLIRPCDWTLFKDFESQALPRNKKAVSSWQNEDEALLTITNELRKVANNFHPILKGQYVPGLSYSETKLPVFHKTMQIVHFILLGLIMSGLILYLTNFSGLKSDTLVKYTGVLGKMLVGIWGIVVLAFGVTQGKAIENKNQLLVTFYKNLFGRVRFLVSFNILFLGFFILLLYQLFSFRKVTFTTSHEHPIQISQDFGASEEDVVYGQISHGGFLSAKLEVGDHAIIYADPSNEELEDYKEIEVKVFWKEMSVLDLSFDE